MVQAKLAWTKTQTRRLVKDVNYLHLGKHIANWPLSELRGFNGDMWAFDLQTDVDDYVTKHIKCPYGQPGDVLWARETWDYAHDECGNPVGDSFGKYLYKASGDNHHGKWRPSIHMPKVASRIWERITEIRVERLQDISYEDSIAEGIQPLLASGMQLATEGQLYKHYTEHQVGIFGTGLKPTESYATLWESINGPGSWDLNPWVWVITTEILSTTGKPKTPSYEPHIKSR